MFSFLSSLNLSADEYARFSQKHTDEYLEIRIYLIKTALDQNNT